MRSSRPWLAGAGLVGVGSYVLLSLMAGPAKCNDGTYSASIGRRGACSHHGGVDTTRDAIAFWLSIFASVFAGKFISKRQSKTPAYIVRPRGSEGRISEVTAPLADVLERNYTVTVAQVGDASVSNEFSVVASSSLHASNKVMTKLYLLGEDVKVISVEECRAKSAL